MRINNSINTAALKYFIVLICSLCSGFLAPVIYAASSGLTEQPTPQPTMATDGLDYAATITVGLSTDGGATYQDSIFQGTEAAITATIQPDLDHIGEEADFFIVQRVGDTFTMKDTDGQFVVWGLSLKTLIPAQESVNLNVENELEVFSGAFNTSGSHRVYIGYMLVDSNVLIFNSVPARFEINEISEGALAFFEANIADQIIGARCIACHVEGGVADGQTSLIYSADPDATQQNFDVLSDFLFSRPDALEYMLSKTSGGEAHIGGVQLPVGSSDYATFEQFLLLLDGDMTTQVTGNNAETFFQALVMQDDQKTLRQAALLFAGRLPTTTEKNAVINETTLRETIRNLMEGDTFHQFLTDAANDRLLVRGVSVNNILNRCRLCFPAFAYKLFEVQEAGLESGSRKEEIKYQRIVGMGIIESPLELIAHVVENDLPYSEILTADYALFNPALNEAVGGTAVFNEDSQPLDFAPGIMEGYYRIDSSVKKEQVPGIQIPKLIDPGNLQTDYPHSGILNTNAYLSRYPSTATNRNRARARWTFYHFLGIDIEASAQRTIDPEALADTDNPTMNNPNCNVCHQIMDPVAGIFQNYGDDGFYRSSFGGKDSLDRFYKSEKDSLYKERDTWYRDMREPGLDGQTAPDAENSVQWLAQEIVNDSRFPTAAVRFWWPAVISRELVNQPEVKTDVDYLDRLLAFDAQQSTLNTLAENFSSGGLDVKDLLIDMVMSEWFRAESYDDPDMALEAHAIVGLGTEKLLTPEQLSRKTRAITGFNWNSWVDTRLGTSFNGLEDQFGLFYGGIDSLNIQERSREMTPLMSTVSMVHGLQSSCPIVLREFTLADDDRLLFSGISEFVTPLSEGNQVITIESDHRQDVESYSFSMSLQTAGAKTISASFINDACDKDPETNNCRVVRNVYITGLEVTRPNGSVLAIPSEQASLSDNDCGGFTHLGTALFGNCTAQYDFTAPQAGQYTVEISVTADQDGDELAMINLEVGTDGDPHTANTNGADIIRGKLVELHDKMLGQNVSSNSAEIDASYELFVDSWQSRQSLRYGSLFNEAELCHWGTDIDFANNLGFPGEALIPVEDRFGSTYELNFDELQPFLNGFATDPLQTKQSWKTVISYLLTHYDYLYE